MGATGPRVLPSTKMKYPPASASSPTRSIAQPARLASWLAPSIRSSIAAGAVTGKPKAGASCSHPSATATAVSPTRTRRIASDTIGAPDGGVKACRQPAPYGCPLGHDLARRRYRRECAAPDTPALCIGPGPATLQVLQRALRGPADVAVSRPRLPAVEQEPACVCTVPGVGAGRRGHRPCQHPFRRCPQLHQPDADPVA